MSTKRTGLFYILYIMLVMVLAGIYFLVPERREFLDYQLKWWMELWQVIREVL